MSLFLAKGQSSNEVLALQEALNLSQPNQEQLVLDGVFGRKTETSVRRWQAEKHLKVDGIAGPETLGSLFEGIDFEDDTTMHITRSQAQAPLPFSPGSVGRYYWDLGNLTPTLEARRRGISVWDVCGFPKGELSVPRLPQGLFDLGDFKPPDVRLGDGDVIIKPVRESGLSVAGEFNLGWTGDRTLETGFKGKLIVPLARKTLKKSEPWSFKPSSLTLAVGGKGTHDGSEGTTAVHFTGRVIIKPFTLERQEWGQLGRRTLTGFSVAPQLHTSYILSRANKHKAAFGVSARPEFTVRRAGSRLYVGFGAEIGVFVYLAISPGKFQVGYHPFITSFLNATVRF